jgi:hypothetical protein
LERKPKSQPENQSINDKNHEADKQFYSNKSTHIIQNGDKKNIAAND